MASMTFTVPDPKWDEFKDAFLAVHPNDSGLTDEQWIKRTILSKIKGVYANGRKMLNPGPIIDDDIAS